MTQVPQNFQDEWSRFLILPDHIHAPKPRSIQTKEGILDRLRAAAFAECQAKAGFLWASQKFSQTEAQSVLNSWKALAHEENKHLYQLISRLETLGGHTKDRPVSSRLWSSYLKCQTGAEFAHYMAEAEERGQKAGERFYQDLKEIDPVTAEIFYQIAKEESEHVRIARTYFPKN